MSGPKSARIGKRSLPTLEARLFKGGIRLETIAWGFLLVTASILRLWDLGIRALSFDESQHALFSFQFFTEGQYIHNPITHGPLLFHLAALTFNFLGASDFTARLWPALAGVALVAALYWFRPLLGRLGALVAAVLITVSPTLLFYSRYLRNDIYICLFSVVWIYSAFRYLRDESPRSLIPMTISMALAFASKETAFIFGFIFGSFGLIMGLGLRPLRLGRRFLDLSVLMLSLVMPFLSPLIQFALGWEVTSYSGDGALIRTVVSAGFPALLGCLGCFLYWKWRSGPVRFGTWARLAGLFWGLEIVLFTTLLSNWSDGIVSGVTGSLGYWLTQQDVGRGGQPALYYFYLALVYELAPLLLGFGGLASILVFFTRRPRLSRSSIGLQQVVRRWLRSSFLLFLVWWCLASWAIYAFAGEKMPWLLSQMVLPLTFLAGFWVQGSLRRTRLRTWSLLSSGLVVMVVWLALLSLMRVLTVEPALHRDLASMRATVEWGGAMIALAGALMALLIWARRDWAGISRHVSWALVLILLVISVRTSFRVNFVNYESARDALVYAHGTSDIKATLGELDRLETCAAKSQALKVAYDNETNWPFGWYLKRRGNSTLIGKSIDKSLRPDVVLTVDKNSDAILETLDGDYLRIQRELIQWPEPFYASLSRGSIGGFLKDAETRRWSLRFLLEGPQLPQQVSTKTFSLLIKRDVAGACLDNFSERLPVATVEREWAGPFDGLKLRNPASVAYSSSGRIAIADSGNHRIVVVESDGGSFAFGSFCRLGAETASECVDPDGAGPLETGDGQFNEPWGVGFDGEGRILVADTWNGRVQIFSGDGTFLRKWGAFGSTADAKARPFSLFGPRHLVADPEGRIIVADTGNKRLLQFSAHGEFIENSWGAGGEPGFLDEPVGLAWSAAGEGLMVADSWNERIQVLSTGLEWLRHWTVDGWGGRDSAFRPYLAVDRSFRVIATDPAHSRIQIFRGDGQRLRIIDLAGPPGGETPAPTGLALSPDGRRLLVSDPPNGRVLEITWPPASLSQPD